MKTQLTILILCLIGLSFYPKLTHPEEVTKQLTPQPLNFLCIPSPTAPPTIDGKIDDQVWQTAPKVTNFQLIDNQSLAKEQTIAWITYDQNNLYIAFKCLDSKINQIKTDHKTHDSEVWKDDCVEVFIDTNLDLKTYYHFIVNAAGAQYNEKSKDKVWDGTWIAKSIINHDYWACEIAIPFKTIGITSPDAAILGFNLCRNQTRLSELSCWNPTFGGFHQPQRFGNLILGADISQSPVKMEIASLGDLAPGGNNYITGKITNHATTTKNLEACIKIIPPSGQPFTNYEQFSLNPSQVEQGALYYYYLIDKIGDHNLILTLMDNDSQKPLYFANLPFSISSLSIPDFGYYLTENNHFLLWWAEATYKIGKDRKPPTQPSPAIQIAAARNEYEPFQLIIHTKTDLKNITIKTSDFELKGTRNKISTKKHLQINLVEYVLIKVPTDSFGSIDDWPDPLTPYEKPFDVPANTNQPLWFTIYIPPNTQPGLYQAEIQILPQNAPPLKVPAQLKVFDFTLPRETHTKTAYGVGVNNEYHGLKNPEDIDKVYDLYLQNFAQHRVAPYGPMDLHPIKYTIEGPKFTINNGILNLTGDQSKSQFLSINYQNTHLGNITCCLDQFERQGVGWQGTGVGWPGLERIKEIKIQQKGPIKCVVDIIGEHFSSSEFNRKFETAYQFTIYANQNWFTSRLQYLKNTDTIDYTIRGYFHLLPPATTDVETYNTANYAAWLTPKGALGAMQLTPDDFSFALSKRDGCHADIYHPINTPLTPGDIFAMPQPKVIIFANATANKEAVDQQYQNIASRLTTPVQVKVGDLTAGKYTIRNLTFTHRLTLTLKEPTGLNRPYEPIILNLQKIFSSLGILTQKPHSFRLITHEGNELPYQLDHNNGNTQLLFEIDLSPHSTQTILLYFATRPQKLQPPNYNQAPHTLKYQQTKDYEISFDFSDFDQAAHRYLDEFGFNAFNCGWTIGIMPAQLGSHPQFTPEFNQLFKRIYTEIMIHLSEKGWLDKGYCYWYDEPAPDRYEFVKKGMQLIKEGAPGLRRLLTICTEPAPTPTFYDYVDIWVPVLSCYDHARAKRRQSLGEWVWWYVCCAPRAPYPNNFIDHPAINHRIKFWMLQKYGATGSLYWSTTYWAYKNPWLDPMSYSTPDHKGTFGNGDGYLLYPPVREPSKEPVIKGPINSIRWELIREGLEDREYFWLLEQQVKRLKAKKYTAPRLNKYITQGEQALKLVDKLVQSLTEYEKDPRKLYQARQQIAEAIERLSRQ